MKRVALAVLALAVIVIMPAAAQTGVPVNNALVLVSPQEDAALRSILAAGGPPSGVQRALETAEELLSTSAHSMSTDASGRFALDAPLEPGTYDVMVFAPGFVASSEVVTAGAPENLTIFMQPSAMLSGRVVDSQGRPVPGIVVAASSPHSANYDVTMDDGVFVLDTGLQTGAHKIYAFKPGVDASRLYGLINGTGLALESQVPAAFKTGPSGYVSQVLEVQLEQGKLTTLNVQLHDSQAIIGTVADSAGNPVQEVAVFAFDGNGTMAGAAAITGSDGRYALNNDLAPGKYTIAVPPLFSGGYAPASKEVAVPAEGAVDIVLDKSEAITGRVTDADGSPVVGATVSAISRNTGNATQLSQLLAAGPAPVKTDVDGRFALDGGMRSGTYIVTASFGGVPVSGSVEAKGGSTADIALDFIETITIMGRVTDAGGRAIEGASVVPGFASSIAGAELFAAKTRLNGEYELVVPIKDNGTASLFDQVAVTADGYESAAAQSNSTVQLDRLPAVQISGVVIAQKPLSPPVETVLTRKGTLVFEYASEQYGVGLQANARVLAATFDPPARSISLDLEGVQDAEGRFEFSIPKEFMSGPFAVTLDGRPAETTNTENQTHSTIAIEHEHGVRQITIQGATAVPEFPLPAALAAAGLAGALVWKRLRP